MFALLFALACQPPPGSSDDRDDTGDDTPNPIDTSVVDPEMRNLSVLTSDGISTVLTVSFDTSAPSVARVELGPDDTYGMTIQGGTTAATHHELVVVGFPERSLWHWRVVADIDGVEVSSGDQLHESGAAPADLPRPTLDIREDGLFGTGLRIVTLIGAGGGVEVVNDAGAVVWWWKSDPDDTITQAHPARDGDGLFFLSTAMERGADRGTLHYVRWDGEIHASVALEQSHHDFVLLPSGRVAYLAADFREFDGSLVAGDTIWEVDVSGGVPTPIWSTWDNVGEPILDGCDLVFYPKICDWTHANSLAYDEENNNFLVSLHNIDLVAKIDPGDHTEWSGRVEWLAGSNPQSAFTFDPPGAAWNQQHAFKPIGGDEYIVFDNGVLSADSYSELWRYRVDETTNVITALWNFDQGQSFHSLFMGDIHHLGSGSMYSAWGTEGELLEVDASGAIVWRSWYDLGLVLGFTDYAEFLGGEVGPE